MNLGERYKIRLKIMWSLSFSVVFFAVLVTFSSSCAVSDDPDKKISELERRVEELESEEEAKPVSTQAPTTADPTATETKPTFESHEMPCGDYLVPVGKNSGWIADSCIPTELVLLPVSVAFDDCYLVPEAAQAVKDLIKEAKSKGIELVAVSCYRSYQYQKEIYDRNVRELGEEKASLEVALPGYSEHQLGTTVDISSAKVNFQLTQDFGDTPEGQWLDKHASDFGFVLSFPKGLESRTGYLYEPWHIRWVGVSLAKTILETDLTLEEYLIDRLGYSPN